MDYFINQISSKTAITSCPAILIDQYNWGGTYRPQTHGYLGFIKDGGFYLTLICEEDHPLATYKRRNDPVYKDSAMEFFLSLDPHNEYYINIEVNAYGAYIFNGGPDKKNRNPLPPMIADACEIKTTTDLHHWMVTMYLPLNILTQIPYFKQWTLEKPVYFNAYKLCEKPGDFLEHYASYAPIQTKSPDFHQPRYFAIGHISF